LEKNFFCIDLSKYRLITTFWNSLPMIFKAFNDIFGKVGVEDCSGWRKSCLR